MNKFLIVLLLGILSGCATDKEVVKPEIRTVKQMEYIVKIPPAELMTLPPATESLDVDNAKQSDIAKWIIAQEARTTSLENLLKGLASFFKLEQEKANDKAKLENTTAIKVQVDSIAETAKTTEKKTLKGE